MATRLFLKPIHSAAPHPSSGIHGKTWTHVLHYCVEVDVCALLWFHQPCAALCVIADVSLGYMSVGVPPCATLRVKANVGLGYLIPGVPAHCHVERQSRCGPRQFDTGGSCLVPHCA